MQFSILGNCTKNLGQIACNSKDYTIARLILKHFLLPRQLQFVNAIFKRPLKNLTVKMPKIKAALIDLSGTLHVEDEATPNAVEALKKLRSSGVIVKFVTNTTKESSRTLLQRLLQIGFEVEQSEIFSSLSAAVVFIKKNSLNPHYLVSEDARCDFPEEDKSRPCDAVAIGLAPKEFHYESLNKAFNILVANPKAQLIAINLSKYYKRSDGLALGGGFFIKGLEFSTGREAVLIGKPNPCFFTSALPEGVSVEECVMIGDDANDDVIGAMRVGMKGVLVKTGKYLPHVVCDPPPTVLLENFSETVDWIIKQNESN